MLSTAEHYWVLLSIAELCLAALSWGTLAKLSIISLLSSVSVTLLSSAVSCKHWWVVTIKHYWALRSISMHHVSSLSKSCKNKYRGLRLKAFLVLFSFYLVIMKNSTMNAISWDEFCKFEDLFWEFLFPVYRLFVNRVESIKLRMFTFF